MSNLMSKCATPLYLEYADFGTLTNIPHLEEPVVEPVEELAVEEPVEEEPVEEERVLKQRRLLAAVQELAVEPVRSPNSSMNSSPNNSGNKRAVIDSYNYVSTNNNAPKILYVKSTNGKCEYSATEPTHKKSPSLRGNGKQCVCYFKKGNYCVTYNGICIHADTKFSIENVYFSKTHEYVLYNPLAKGMADRDEVRDLLAFQKAGEDEKYEQLEQELLIRYYHKYMTEQSNIPTIDTTSDDDEETIEVESFQPVVRKKRGRPPKKDATVDDTSIKRSKSATKDICVSGCGVAAGWGASTKRGGKCEECYVKGLSEPELKAYQFKKRNADRARDQRTE